MPDLLDALRPFYPWVKALHIVAMTAWMAGIFYLPRLFVYHVEGYEGRGVPGGGEMDLLFQRQERLLLRAIMTPALIATWVLGLLLAAMGGWWSAPWLWAKLTAVLALTAFHGWCARRRRAFAAGTNALSGRTYRLMNEVPTLLLLVIVVLVVVKPF